MDKESLALESILGYGRAGSFRSLEDDENKQIIAHVLDFLSERFEHLSWSGLRIGHSNAEIEELQENIKKLDLEVLKLKLDIEGFEGVPDQWLDFASFLVKVQRGKAYECNNLLGDLAKMIVMKVAGYQGDKDFIRTFYKVPVAQLIKFFKKYQISKKEECSSNA